MDASEGAVPQDLPTTMETVPRCVPRDRWRWLLLEVPIELLFVLALEGLCIPKHLVFVGIHALVHPV